MKSTTDIGWDTIERVADQLGIRKNTVAKWKERKCIPYKWRLPIIIKSNGKISLRAFDEPLNKGIFR
jgi:hypothetical protein